MAEEVKEQILSIRDSGLTNMLDIRTVQRIAYTMEFYELVLFLEENPKGYLHFILTGEDLEEENA